MEPKICTLPASGPITVNLPVNGTGRAQTCKFERLTIVHFCKRAGYSSPARGLRSDALTSTSKLEGFIRIYAANDHLSGTMGVPAARAMRRELRHGGQCGFRHFSSDRHGCDNALPMPHPFTFDTATVAANNILYGRFSLPTGTSLCSHVPCESSPHCEIVVDLSRGFLSWRRLCLTSEWKSMSVYNFQKLVFNPTILGALLVDGTNNREKGVRASPRL